MEIGYACINTTLKSKGVYTNRGMIKRTFDSKGVNYVSDLVLQNVIDLYKIVQWNEANGIKFYRMSSDIFPWMDFYKLEQLKDLPKILEVLSKVGKFANENNHRLTFHPGPFNVLASSNKNVIHKTIIELNNHSKIMDLIGLSKSPYSKINIHVGGAYGNKSDALKRWVDNFDLLDDNTKSRLTIENDDKSSLFTVLDLMYIHENTGIPIVFDYHHYNCNPGDMNLEDSLKLALSTWQDHITPAVHVSEPRDSKKFRAHHDYIVNEVNTFGKNFDAMFEAKAKELAVIKYKKLYNQVVKNELIYS